MAKTPTLLSESGAHRTHSLIFVTIGTDQHPFARLMDWLQRAIGSEAVAAEKIIVQHGYTKPFNSSNVDFIAFLPFYEVRKIMENADLIITHPSTTAFEAIDCGKIPIVVPRLKRFRLEWHPPTKSF